MDIMSICINYGVNYINLSPFILKENHNVFYNGLNNLLCESMPFLISFPTPYPLWKQDEKYTICKPNIY